MDSCTIPIAPLLKISKEEDDEEYVDEEDVCRECDDVDDGCEEFSMASFSVKYTLRARRCVIELGLATLSSGVLERLPC